MRIGVSTLMMQRGKTGVAQYLFGLLQAIEGLGTGHQFTLFVLEEDLSLFNSLRRSMTLIPVAERHRSPVKNIAWHQLALPALVRRLEPDVLHVPSYRRLLWQKPCPLIGTIHDLAPFHVSGKYDWKRMFYGRVIVRRLAHRQDRIIAVSHNTAQDLVKFFGLPRNRIEVIHNGIDHQRFKPGKASGPESENLGKYRLQKPFFLYVARLEHPAKNHVRLIQAFELFKKQTNSDWQLVFGGSDWHGAEVIHLAIERSPCRQDIHSLGFVADDVLPDLYRTAEAFVYPSLFEGFGLPPIEAMACGCPVISSTCGSLGEVVGEAALIVDPLDINQMAHQLGHLASDQELRNRMRGLGIERARRFDWNLAAAATVRAYEGVAAHEHATEFVRGSEAPIRY
jgi:glycosyltransferase involved in cell wall biosynthesis